MKTIINAIKPFNLDRKDRDDRIYWIPTGKFHIDESYQRPVSIPRAQYIFKNFDVKKFNILVVNQRNNGFYYLIDGQHRLLAARKRGLSHVPCLVYYGLSVQQEAELRLALGTRKADTSQQVFKLKLRKGDSIALRIAEILKDAGLKLNLHGGGNKMARGINCVGSLQQILETYRNGAQLLRQTLDVSVKAWPDDSLARSGRIILGIASFLYHYPEAAEDKLCTKLERVTPAWILAQGRSQITAMGMNVDKAIALIILAIYNRHQSSKLPDRFNHQED